MVNAHERKIEHENEALRSLFSSAFPYYFLVNLENGITELGGSDMQPERAMATRPWEKILNIICKEHVVQDDQDKFLSAFSLDRLRESGQRYTSCELRCRGEAQEYCWVEFGLARVEKPAPLALVTVRDISGPRMLQSIVERYVYRTCDFFLYLDAKVGHYTLYSAHKDPNRLPPMRSGDYAQAVENSVKRFIAPEDQEMVLREMQLDRVIEMLDLHGEHTFFCGAMHEERGYTRKQMHFLYFDRTEKTIMLICTDVTQGFLEERMRRDQLRRAHHLAQTDPLTQVYNHRAIKEMIEATLCDETIKCGALFFLDLDDFKLVNDRFGHSQGDDTLRGIANMLRSSVRVTDLVGRVGGDEFVLFLPGITGDEDIARYAERLCALRETDEKQSSISVSVGIARYPEDGRDYSTLSRRADLALYRAKREGKRRYAFYTAEQ